MIGKQVRVDVIEAISEDTDNQQQIPDSRIEDKFIAKGSEEIGKNLTKQSKPKKR